MSKPKSHTERKAIVQRIRDLRSMKKPTRVLCGFLPNPDTTSDPVRSKLRMVTTKASKGTSNRKPSLPPMPWDTTDAV